MAIFNRYGSQLARNQTNKLKVKNNPLLMAAVNAAGAGRAGVGYEEIETFTPETNILEPEESAQATEENFTEYQGTDYQTVQDDLLRQALASLSSVRNASTEDRAALDSELQSKAAKTLLDQRARVGASGMGLSGAGLSLESGTKGKLDRDKALALGEFDRGARAELLNAVSNVANITQGFRQADIAADRADHDQRMSLLALKELEAELGIDLDGDGVVSTGQQPGAEEPDPDPVYNPEDFNNDGTVSNAEKDEAEERRNREDRMDFGDDVLGWTGITGPKEPPPDADTYSVWPYGGEPVGFITGRDDTYFYVVGLDGKRWKVERSKAAPLQTGED